MTFQGIFTNGWDKQSGWLFLLLPLEWLYKFLAYCSFIYHTKIRRRPSIDVPILVVGNITTGGAGKTPAVITLAHELSDKGLKVGIISRGYKRTNSEKGKMKAREVMEVLVNHRAEESGDEPLLLAQRSGCPVFVCANRYLAARKLVANHNIDVIISDDGLQHYAMRRNIELAVVDASTGFGNLHCLPVGPLREPRTRLRRVDFILMNLINLEKGEQIKPELPSGRAPTFSMEYNGSSCIQLNPNLGNGSNKEISIAQWKEMHKGKTIHAVAGIARPQNFFSLLERNGISFIPHEFNNHHKFKPNDINFGADSIVIMTEKDAVKCNYFAMDNPKNYLWALRINASIDEKLIKAILGLLADGDL